MEERKKSAECVLSNLAVNKKVIPITYLNGDFWHTDLKLPDLVLTNHGPGTVTIEKVAVRGFARGQEVIQLTADQQTLVAVTHAIHQVLNKQLHADSVWAAYNLGMLFGKLSPLPYPFADPPLPPNSAACLRLQDLVGFHYVGPSVVDRVQCEVELACEGRRQSLVHENPLTPYTCKGDYIFPLKGRVTLTGMPINQVMGHRLATSQEFAFDVVDFRPMGNGGFSPSDPPGSEHVKDYFLFEREVLAVGDGVVVASGNRWPNAWAEPISNPDDRIVEQSMALLEDGVDFVHVILGNFAIIDHQNGEFSVYAHMSENTVTVQPGDQVRQGQVIGRVGNTSNSDFPHLHFHLMDSPDFLTANGLPIRFKNIPDAQPGLWDYKSANTLLYSDYNFLNIAD